ncbi:hypothetical protein HMPREF9194_01805 [Treponema maltophilum ATCC 51939]|uniref:Endonuclease/exonuclease/phosphatase domain-containing protein n=2 Tax=Treponema maltophilum TaxID=51160 RepID=S3L3S9_TREMA|nr:hypothetical protein HMPREF9194_01805 [Treponema maltophilum ATCC 51939]
MNPFKTAAVCAASLIGAGAFLFAVLILVLSITEYRPAQTENAVVIEGAAGKAGFTDAAFDAGQSVRIISWNIGYGALGAKQDFFMDGGTMVRPESRAAVEENLTGIADFIKAHEADMWFLQELDVGSARSFYVDESRFLSQATALGGNFACNYKSLFVPFPFPPLGRVVGGLATFTQFVPKSSIRYSLPVPFKWPVRLANLKRCLLVNRFPLASGKELVAVNLHLEAYDEGEGKAAQTKALMDFLTAEYEKGNYVIAGGDFNQTFPDLNMARYPKHEGLWQAGILDAAMLPEGWRFAADDAVPSCRLNNGVYESALYDETVRKNWQYYIIDGFILSPNVELQSVCTFDESFVYSDHNPVELTVYLKP